MQLQRNVNTRYLRDKIETATPIGRIIILFEGCEKFLTQSKEALVRGDKVTFVERNIRAQNILRELRNSLNLDVDEKVGGEFYTIYNFMIRQLMKAVRTRNVGPIEQVMKINTQLLSSWKEAEGKGLGKELVQ